MHFSSRLKLFILFYINFFTEISGNQKFEQTFFLYKFVSEMNFSSSLKLFILFYIVERRVHVSLGGPQVELVSDVRGDVLELTQRGLHLRQLGPGQTAPQLAPVGLRINRPLQRFNCVALGTEHVVELLEGDADDVLDISPLILTRRHVFHGDGV